MAPLPASHRRLLVLTALHSVAVSSLTPYAYIFYLLELVLDHTSPGIINRLKKNQIVSMLRFFGELRHWTSSSPPHLHDHQAKQSIYELHRRQPAISSGRWLHAVVGDAPMPAPPRPPLADQCTPAV